MLTLSETLQITNSKNSHNMKKFVVCAMMAVAFAFTANAQEPAKQECCKTQQACCKTQEACCKKDKDCKKDKKSCDKASKKSCCKSGKQAKKAKK